MKQTIKNFVKITAAGAALWAIAFYIVAASPTVEEPLVSVQDAEADVAWLDTGDDGHEFTRAMNAAGLKPRPYDLNGNVMYFASGKVKTSPAEVEDVIQDVMVEYGINSKNYAGAATGRELSQRADRSSEQGIRDYGKAVGSSELSEAIINGEVVPTERHKGYVAMSSLDYGKTSAEIMDGIQTGEITSVEELSPKGYRFIEATYEPDSGMTDIQAVWTGKGFDNKKMNNTAFKQQAADPNVPACVGCERKYRFQSLSENEPLRSNHWNTPMSLDSTYEFYKGAMARRGWRESNVQKGLNKITKEFPNLRLSGRLLNLEKPGKAMQIVLLPDGKGGSMVMSQERYSGAESVIPKLKNSSK